MPSLKSLKLRIKSIKSTQKITKAMQMVSAAKLRRARLKLDGAVPYASAMKEMINTLANSIDISDENVNPQLVKLLNGKGSDNKHLLIITSSDRGLCGSFNTSIAKAAKQRISELTTLGKQFEIVTVGSKGFDLLKQQFSQKIINSFDGLSKKTLHFSDIIQVADKIIDLYLHDKYDTVTIVYNHFKSAITQEVTFERLLPFTEHKKEKDSVVENFNYSFEPEQNIILENLIIKNIRTRIYHALLENAASEQGARMTAMDNATRNAGEMINDLSLEYNRTRQAHITKELIEIISGAEAV
ncbi:MAG: F0F1 ATP synthase subunit gamma [Sphingobacteriia bacterium]|nr:F0F1 ATP synthase subunit gamma [Sphingobacteriia bacterium]